MSCQSATQFEPWSVGFSSWCELPRSWGRMSCSATCVNTTSNWTRASKICWDSKSALNLPLRSPSHPTHCVQLELSVGRGSTQIRARNSWGAARWRSKNLRIASTLPESSSGSYWSCPQVFNCPWSSPTQISSSGFQSTPAVFRISSVIQLIMLRQIKCYLLLLTQ